MIGALRNQKLLSAILPVAARPISYNFAHVRPNLSRTVASAVPRSGATGFSVSFAPEPKSEDQAPAKASAEAPKNKKEEERKEKQIQGQQTPKAKAEKRSANRAEAVRGIKARRKRYSSPRRNKGSHRHATTVAVPENS